MMVFTGRGKVQQKHFIRSVTLPLLFEKGHEMDSGVSDQLGAHHGASVGLLEPPGVAPTAWCGARFPVPRARACITR
jgi:hypothetical protein